MSLIAAKSTQFIHQAPTFSKSPGLQQFVYSIHDLKPCGIAHIQKSVFGAPIRGDIMHKVLVYQLAMERGVLHAPYAAINQRGNKWKSAVGLSRSEMPFSGRKIMQQKGGGRARMGTRGSPMLVGGGRAFPRKYIDFKMQLPKKVQQFGVRSALASKYAQNQLMVLSDKSWEDQQSTAMQSTDEESFDKLQTSMVQPLELNWTLLKQFAEAKILQVGAPGKFLLLHSDVEGDAFSKTQTQEGKVGRRNYRMQALKAKDVNVFDVLRNDYLLMTQQAVVEVERIYHKI